MNNQKYTINYITTTKLETTRSMTTDTHARRYNTNFYAPIHIAQAKALGPK